MKPQNSPTGKLNEKNPFASSVPWREISKIITISKIVVHDKQWGAWGTTTNPKTNTTSKHPTNYVYCKKQCNTPFFAKLFLSNGRNSPLPRWLFLRVSEGG